LGKKCHKGIGEDALAEGVGVVDAVRHQRHVGDALAPKTTISRGGISQAQTMGSSEAALGGNKGAGVVVDVLFPGEVHPLGKDVVGREDDPLGADLLKISENFAVAGVEFLWSQTQIVNKFTNDKVGLRGQHFFGVIVRATRGFRQIAASIAAAPGFGYQLDLGLGVSGREAAHKLFLPAVGGTGQIDAIGNAVAPGENADRTARRKTADQSGEGRTGGDFLLRIGGLKNRKQVVAAETVNTARQVNTGEVTLTRGE
jgi:hypothetical protein